MPRCNADSLRQAIRRRYKHVQASGLPGFTGNCIRESRSYGQSSVFVRGATINARHDEWSAVSLESPNSFVSARIPVPATTFLETHTWGLWLVSSKG